MFEVGTHNQVAREAWLEKTLKRIPAGSRILDAGAGEQAYKRFCKHLNYVAQDFAKYDGRGNASGLQMGKCSGYYAFKKRPRSQQRVDNVLSIV